jgi:hypothetical protein
MKKKVLKIDGIFLVVMGTLAGITDVVAYVSGKGPFGQTYFHNSITIGGFEAHCLAVISGFILVVKHRASDAVLFNKVAIVIHAVLGTCNLIWFQVFSDTDMIPMGFITTIAHFTFVILNAIAVFKTRSSGFVKQPGIS